MKKQITLTKGDNVGTIDSLIEFLSKAKELGATHYEMTWSQDPVWAFKWFETYRETSDEEIRQEKIDNLKQQLKELE